MCTDEMFIYSADVSYLPLSEMGHMAMLHSNQGMFSLLKYLFEINLNQMTMNSIVFCLTAGADPRISQREGGGLYTILVTFNTNGVEVV